MAGTGVGASRPASTRSWLVTLAVAGVVAIAGAGCKGACRQPPYVDLIQALPSAEQRSQLPRQAAIVVADVDVNGQARQSLRTCGPSRIIWTTCLPRNAVIRTALALDPEHSAPGAALALRIGVSGKRRYDLLLKQEFPPSTGPGALSWVPVSLRLSRYTDFQWSLFYRPWELPWDIVFSTDAELVNGQPACGYWALPRIESGESRVSGLEPVRGRIR